MLARMRTRGA